MWFELSCRSTLSNGISCNVFWIAAKFQIKFLETDEAWPSWVNKTPIFHFRSWNFPITNYNIARPLKYLLLAQISFWYAIRPWGFLCRCGTQRLCRNTPVNRRTSSSRASWNRMHGLNFKVYDFGYATNNFFLVVRPFHPKAGKCYTSGCVACPLSNPPKLVVPWITRGERKCVSIFHLSRSSRIYRAALFKFPAIFRTFNMYEKKLIVVLSDVVCIWKFLVSAVAILKMFFPDHRGVLPLLSSFARTSSRRW